MKILDKFHNQSLKTKIIIFTVLISIIPVIIIAVFSFQILSSNLTDQKISNIYTNLRSISQSVNSIVNTRKISALRLAKNTAVINLLDSSDKMTEKQRNESLYVLDRFFSEYPNTIGVDTVCIYNAKGDFFTNSTRTLPENDYFSRLENFTAANDTDPWFSDVEIADDAYVFPYNIPIFRSSDQHPSGMITVNILESELASTYSYYETQSDLLFFIDADSRITSAEDKSKIGLHLRDILGDPNVSLDAAKNHFVNRYNGEDVLVSYLKNEPSGIHVVCISSLKSINDAKDQIISIYLISLIASLAVVVFIAVYLSNNLTKPLNKLVKIIQSMQTNELSDSSTLFKYQDEIGIIGKALDTMTVNLKKSSEQVIAEQKAKREAEFNTLLMQINPHFLYNTLSSAIWMIQLGEKDESIELITALSELFKLGVNRGREEITVGDEIEYVENYLKIQKIRYKDRFTYKIICPESLRQEKTIKLLLQPLIENAIYHGIDPSDEAGEILVVVWLQNETLYMQVKNRPSSLKQEDIDHINSCIQKSSADDRFGIGLKNVNERIILAYGSDYGIRFSLEDFYTTVTVTIPRDKNRGENRL